MKVLDFSSFPKHPDSIMVKNKIYLSDNLNSDGDRICKMRKMNELCKVSVTTIIVCVEGSAKMIINDRHYDITPRCIITLTANSFFRLLDLSDDFKGCMIAISRDIIDFGKDVRLGMALLQYTMYDPVGILSEQYMEEAKMLYHFMKNKLREKNYMFKVGLVINVIEILRQNQFQTVMNQNDLKPGKHPSSHKCELCVQFGKLVSDNYRKEHHMQFYADELDVTPKYLSAIIKEISGRHGTEWIDDYIILEARTMLKDGVSSIKDICKRLNFNTPSAFSKYFLNHTGMTPGKYKKRKE